MTWLAERIDQRALEGLERIYGRGQATQGNPGVVIHLCSGKCRGSGWRSKVAALIRVFPFVGGWRA